MQNNRYIVFFEEIKSFLEKQKRQRMRDLNDYNILNVARNENQEIGIHFNVIYSLDFLHNPKKD